MSEQVLGPQETRDINESSVPWLGNFLCVVAKVGLEARGRITLWDALRERSTASLVEVLELGSEEVEINGDAQLNLRDYQGMCALFRGADRVLVDFTGLSHPAWTSLIRAAREVSGEVWALYAEPGSYRVHLSPASMSVFDLSEQIHGLAPLPGLATLWGERDYDESVFVALLGFEGERALHLASHFDPLPEVVPIVGVPGYRIEYPTVAVSCNREFLAEADAYGSLRYARANCPFEAYETLKCIRRDHPRAFMYVAPVGTKPHALGAVLFACDTAGVEVMYDHPVRKRKRTEGTGRVLAYRVK